MESFLSSDAWKQQWTDFWSAPGVIGPLILIVGGVVWWFRGSMFEREIAGLKEQIAALEQRLKLATEQMAASVRATDELEKQIQLYKDEVFLEGKMASSADVDDALVKVAESNALTSETPARRPIAGEPGHAANWRPAIRAACPSPKSAPASRPRYSRAGLPESP